MHRRACGSTRGELDGKTESRCPRFAAQGMDTARRRARPPANRRPGSRPSSDHRFSWQKPARQRLRGHEESSGKDPSGRARRHHPETPRSSGARDERGAGEWRLSHRRPEPTNPSWVVCPLVAAAKTLGLWMDGLSKAPAEPGEQTASCERSSGTSSWSSTSVPSKRASRRRCRWCAALCAGPWSRQRSQPLRPDALSDATGLFDL